MNTFNTRSAAGRNCLVVVLTYLVMFALAFLGLTVAVITWIYLESMLLLCFLLCIYLVGKTHWELEFQDDCLQLLNTGNKQRYCFQKLRQQDLVIRQTSAQAKKNRCDLVIQGTPFRLSDVKHHQELMAYIQQNLAP